MKPLLLLVEDDPVEARRLESAVALMGYEATHARDGDEALALMERMAFDVVLLDLVLPELDGMGLLGAMKARGLCVPVVAAVTAESIDMAASAIRAGARDFVVKPAGALRLQVALANAIALGGARKTVERDTAERLPVERLPVAPAPAAPARLAMVGEWPVPAGFGARPGTLASAAQSSAPQSSTPPGSTMAAMCARWRRSRKRPSATPAPITADGSRKWRAGSASAAPPFTASFRGSASPFLRDASRRTIRNQLQPRLLRPSDKLTKRPGSSRL